ncbi:MAG: SDR family oxidoreductase [Bacteriovorax sp.]|jgi:thioester reductase-like protein
MKIFITGATGFLGNYLVNILSSEFETIYVLTRNADFSGFNHLANVKLVKGDITSLSIIESDIEKEEVVRECSYAIHAAAIYDMKASHAECYMQNVLGTQNTLRLIKKMKNLKAFYYISTIAVGDDQTFFLEEDHFPSRRKFNDSYSETKYHAERLVREATLIAPIRIIRPGIIVGNSETGEMNKVDGPYYFIEAMKKYSRLLRAMPFMPLAHNPRTKIPLIPVDHCAHYISLLIKRDDYNSKVKTYHLISHEIPSVKEFLEDLNQAFGIKTIYLPTGKNLVNNSLLKLFGIPKEVVPFMFSRLSYDKTHTIEEVPELKSSTYSTFKKSLFGNCF